MTQPAELGEKCSRPTGTSLVRQAVVHVHRKRYRATRNPQYSKQWHVENPNEPLGNEGGMEVACSRDRSSR
jgi:hypothetical protein